VLARYPEIATTADVTPVPFRSRRRNREWLHLPAVIDRLAIGSCQQIGSHSGCRERFNILESAA
jgi:hypothetical protein